MIMLQTTNDLMAYSVTAGYLMNNMGYLVAAGGLSYNLPQLFKLKSETGYIVRAGIMSLASLSIIPAAMIMPESYPMALKLVTWGCCFMSGIIFTTYGARKLQAKFSLLFSRFTVKSSVRRGAKTDIRYMAKELPAIPNYNPLKFINLKKGVFVGLDENVKPIYLQNADDWYKRHFLIVGATRSGKGVAMQYLGVQSLMLGETVVFLDPKGDKYMPHIFKEQCEKLGVPYTFIDLTQNAAQINLIADFTARDLKNCLVEAFSQREMGSESDVYRKNEQEFLENLANFISQQNQTDNLQTNSSVKSLAELCRDYDLSRYADKYKSSVSDLNKLVNIPTINAANGKSISELISAGGCVYIVGDLLDETIKKIQRFIFCRVVQLARNHSNLIELRGGEEQSITVFADELVAHVSRFVAESYTVSLGWGLKIISAIQDLKLLRGAPADIDPEFLKGAVFGNSQNKLFYRADDIDTADFLSDMTGKIQIEEEQKIVTRNSLNSEKLDKQTRLTQSERNYFDRNMILNLKQFEAVFCASLSYRSTIACLCKTSPVKAPGSNQTNGKQLIKVEDKAVAQAEEINHSLANQANDNTNQAHSFVEQWQQQNQQTKATKESHNLNGEHHARNKQSTTGGTTTTSDNNQAQKASTSKSDYLF
ncbi:MAG: hypothetical protein EKK57_09020 [Proteobacteria bacterium]|nr:MAG: hypothetical protein EKK57_09020 [Pseudomonadota bacterium]